MKPILIRGKFPTSEFDIAQNRSYELFRACEDLMEEFKFNFLDVDLLPFKIKQIRVKDYDYNKGKVGVESDSRYEDHRIVGLIDSAYGPSTYEMCKAIEKFMIKFRLPKITACWCRSELDVKWVKVKSKKSVQNEN